MLSSKNHPQNFVLVLWHSGSLNMERGTTERLPSLALPSTAVPPRNETSLMHNPRPSSRESTTFNNSDIMTVLQRAGFLGECFTHPYPLRPGSHSFPASPPGIDSGEQGPGVPTPPGWSPQICPWRSTVPRILNIFLFRQNPPPSKSKEFWQNSKFWESLLGLPGASSDCVWKFSRDYHK